MSDSNAPGIAPKVAADPHRQHTSLRQRRSREFGFVGVVTFVTLALACDLVDLFVDNLCDREHGSLVVRKDAP